MRAEIFKQEKKSVYPPKLQRRRAAKILARLKKLHPNAKIALQYKTPMQLLVAVMLSAQTTDKQVNKVTEKLFKRYKTSDDFANAKLSTFAREIKSTGFYKTKAKNVIAAARMIRDRFGGKLPRTIEEMTKLPGVGRKTANIVLGNIYGVAEGIAVDTHVARLAQKFKFSGSRDPKKIEQDLMALFPKKEWLKLSYYFQAHGRTCCTARKKNKKDCALSDLY